MCCGFQFGALGLLFSLLLGPCCPQSPPVAVTLGIAPTTIAENGAATLTATLAAAAAEEITLHVEGQQTPSTSTPGFTLSGSDIVIAAGATTGTATVTAATFPGDLTSLSVVFSITRISTATCSWDANIPAGPLTIVHPGGLQVTLIPAEAVTAGAKWSVDGGAMQDSGATVQPLTAGSHTVTYQAIAHWDAPAIETVIVTDGALTQITRSYTPRPGSLVVNLSPDKLPGTAWSIDTAPSVSHPGGFTLTGLAPGTYAVDFTDVQGWITPVGQSATIVSDQTTVIDAIYIQLLG